LRLPNETRTALELFFEEHETKSFLETGYYSYNDFIKFGEFIGVQKA